MRVTIDLMKKSTQIIDLSNVINPRVGDDDLQLPLHVGYGDNLFDMRGKDVEFLSNDPNKKNIYIAGTCNTNTPGDNLYMGNLTFRFPAGTFKADGTYDPDKTMFRIVDKETQKVISSVNVKITVMKNNIEFDFDPDKSSYDSRAETMLHDFYDKGQAMLDEIKDLNNQAKSNVSGDTATTAKEAKKQADQNAGDISDMQGEIASARGRFANMAGREDAQDAAINQKESIANANANYAELKRKDAQQDNAIAQKAGKYELEEKLAQMNLQPEMYADLNAVNAAYPNGTTKFIATDDGYLALYRNGQWIKGPVFQATGIADNSISDAKLQTVSVDRLRMNDIDLSNLKAFSGGKINVNGDYITMSVDGSDGGVFLPIKVGKTNRTFISLRIVNVVNGGLTAQPQIYNADTSYNVGHQLYSYEYKEGLAASFNMETTDDQLMLLFAIHGKGQVTIQVQASSFGGGFVDFRKTFRQIKFADELKTSHDNDIKLWNTNTSPDSSKNLLYRDNKVVRFEQKVTTGDFGILYLVDVDTTQKQYLNLKYRAKGNCDVYLVGDKMMKIADLNTDGALHVLRYATNLGYLQSNGVNNVRNILVATHGENSKFEIYGFNFSSLNGDTSIARTIDDISDQVGSNDLTRIGSLDHLSDKLAHDGITYASDNLTVGKDNQVIRTIEIQAKKDSNITFVVGTIDQNGLLVNATEHPSWVHAGYNELSVDWTINTGQRLFVKWDSDVFDLYKASEFWEKALIQDGTHQSTKVGYEGYSFYSIDGQVPMTYSYNDMTVQEQLANAEQKLAETNNQLKELSSAKNKRNIIRDNDGTAYRLVINNGTLGIQNATPNKVAIFGNSLTSNTGGIGMAASDQYHDWYYLTSQYIKSHNPNAVINDRLNVSTWEQAENSEDRQSIFENTIKPQLSADTDLVILQLGDNINNDARKATIEEDSKTLIHNIKQVSPNAEVYWLASWFGNSDLIGKIHNACLSAGATHININDLNTKANQSSIGATRTGLDGKSWQVVNPGAAVHPGDAGMKAIADRLIANFDF